MASESRWPAVCTSYVLKNQKKTKTFQPQARKRKKQVHHQVFSKEELNVFVGLFCLVFDCLQTVDTEALCSR